MSGIEPTGPNLRGPCPSCGEDLATDQRYCVTCGHRLGPALTLPYPGAGAGTPNRFGLPMPMRLASTLVLSTLVFGVVVGTAMSTALSERVTPPAPHVAQVPQPPEPKQKAPSPEPAAPAPIPSVASTPDFTSPYAPGLSTPSTDPTKVKVPPQLIKGTVVQTNPVAGSYAVAQGGPLVSIHARSLPSVGSRVITPVRQLVNGTYAEDGKRKTKGQTDKATFTGVVTFRDDAAGNNFYSVSSTGSSVLVSVTPDAAGKATLPPFGSSVTAEVRLEPLTAATPPPPADPTTGAPPTTTTTPATPPAPLACDDGQELSPTVSQADKKLVQTKVDVVGQTVTDGDLEGVVQAVCPGSRQIVLSADSTRDSKRDILLSVDRAIDLSRISVGRAVEAGVSLASPSSLTVNGIASDQGAKSADSQKQVQGTL